MSLDGELRELLAAQADGSEGPVPDLAALRAGGLTRRRRRRRRLAAVAAAVAAGLVVAVGAGVAVKTRDARTTGIPADPPAGAGFSKVPWCVPDPAGGQRIVGEGPPIGTTCYEIHEALLWHHAGTTILVSGGTVQRVADGRLTPLGRGDGEVSMSHDGRVVAWLNCGADPLQVFEVGTATRVATTGLHSASCGHVAGIDDLGRVYVIVDGLQRGALDVRMYDTRSRRWRQVSGVPPGGGPVTYVTADGFAVQTAEAVVTAPGYRDVVPVASVEGRVDDAGRFVLQRDVPIGRGRWSPDRSLVVDHQAEGAVVRRADLTSRVVLGLPAYGFAAAGDLLWESPTVILATVPAPTGSRVYRCDARSGSCHAVDQPGWPALGSNARLAG